ncbi:UNVERIFIED_CONTAM: hypothetical protein Sangu_1923700 [Sesamum angustifolium]|uniref:Uncharacterized protein n=1 Tax=Sesamum angustifolium TaxID=2727405 RepID=A0AAW2LV03_9LAMI
MAAGSPCPRSTKTRKKSPGRRSLWWLMTPSVRGTRFSPAVGGGGAPAAAAAAELAWAINS